MTFLGKRHFRWLFLIFFCYYCIPFVVEYSIAFSQGSVTFGLFVVSILRHVVPTVVTGWLAL